MPNYNGRITITPYDYHGWQHPQGEVYVIKGDEHPDPSRRMMWGRRKNDEIVSDFKGFFHRKGKPITLYFSTKGLHTYGQEKSMALKAVDCFLREGYLDENNRCVKIRYDEMRR